MAGNSRHSLWEEPYQSLPVAIRLMKEERAVRVLILRWNLLAAPERERYQAPMSTTRGEDWTQLLLRPQAIRTVYAYSAPSFAVLHEIVLSREGPRAELRLELDRFADNPPKRWEPCFNRVQVILRFDELREINIERLGWDGKLAQGAVERRGDEVRFLFVGPDVSVKGTSITVDVQRVEGYAVNE